MREAFQRALLEARIANDAKANDAAIIEEQLKEDFMGSEVWAASMGGPEKVPFAVANTVAASAAAAALQEIEAEEGGDGEAEDGERRDAAAPAAASAVVADAAERMITGEDIALDVAFLASSAQDEEGRKEEEEEERVATPRLLVNDAILSEADRWRKDYVCEVRQ